MTRLLMIFLGSALLIIGLIFLKIGPKFLSQLQIKNNKSFSWAFFIALLFLSTLSFSAAYYNLELLAYLVIVCLLLVSFSFSLLLSIYLKK